MRIDVPLPGSPHAIRIGTGLLDGPDRPDPFFASEGRLLVVADRRAADHHLERVFGALRRWGEEPLQELVPPGEGSKSMERALLLVERLREEGFDRGCRLLALGGGVTGDLTGFVASLFMRGIRFFQVPTTLLAQVDASIGGKVGINHAGIKNYLGHFHQPSGVLIDTTLLATLPGREYRSGLAEVVKTAVIGDEELFSYLEANLPGIETRDDRVLRHVIERCVRFKVSVVLGDERERGARALLNFGHTVGHALEMAGGEEGRLLHGEAISVGMIAACHVGESLGLAPAGLRLRVEQLLVRMELPIRCVGFDPETVLERIRYDKKFRSGRAGMVLTSRVGAGRVGVHFPPEVLRESLQRILE